MKQGQEPKGMVGIDESKVQKPVSMMNSNKFKDYAEIMQITKTITFEKISEWIEDNLTEVKGKVAWVQADPSTVVRRIGGSHNPNVLEVLARVTMASAQYDAQGNIGFQNRGLDMIPVLILDQSSVTKKVKPVDNLQGAAHDIYEIDQDLIKHKNKQFFPESGWLSAMDDSSGQVMVHLDIINVLREACGYSAEEVSTGQNQMSMELVQYKDAKRFVIDFVLNKWK